VTTFSNKRLPHKVVEWDPKADLERPWRIISSRATLS
jgi:hypothetical protein